MNNHAPMNNQQRGVYQPLVENIPIYDLNDDEGEDEERSRWPLLIVIGMIVAAAFTGVVYLAYNQGVERGKAGSTIVINPQEGPVRTAPPDAPPSTPFTDLKIYNTPVPPDQEANTSKLAATTPTPVPPPTTEAPPVRLTPGPAVSPAPSQRVAPPPPAPPPVAQARPVAPPPAPPPPAAQTRPAAPPAVAPAPPPAVAQAAPPAARSPAASGSFVLQLGAYQTQELAETGWKTFRTRYADVTSNLSDDIQRADLGARGIWYRLRIGPFTDKPSAQQSCERLKGLGGTCIVVAP